MITNAHFAIDMELCIIAITMSMITVEAKNNYHITILYFSFALILKFRSPWKTHQSHIGSHRPIEPIALEIE